MEVHFRTENNTAIVGYSHYDGSLPKVDDVIVHHNKRYIVLHVVHELGSHPVVFVYCKEIKK